MSIRQTIPRRALLFLAALVPFGAARRAAADDRVTKEVAKYQNLPNGQQRCEICLQYDPPGHCKIVAGAIIPTGWCQFFAARDNAH
jgi:hypothetical protein